jgi:putative ABC transport system ATP-binding protein
MPVEGHKDLDRGLRASAKLAEERIEMFLWNRKGNRSPVADGAIGDAIIYAHKVVKTYDTGTSRVQALKGVDFAVQRGELVGVMGPSGCGKTTLLNCLSGLDGVDGGQIWLEGKDLAKMSDKERTDYRARRMGFIFQVYNLLPVLSAVENVELPLLVSGVGPKEARMRSIAALERVGLAQWAKHRPAELSGGQRQRVTIARALVNSPALIWADEPTGALDSKTANEIMGLLRELNERDGLTCVIVTHDPGIGDRCDRVVRMRDGYVIGEAGPRVIAEAEAVAAAASAAGRELVAAR